MSGNKRLVQKKVVPTYIPSYFVLHNLRCFGRQGQFGGQKKEGKCERGLGSFLMGNLGTCGTVSPFSYDGGHFSFMYPTRYGTMGLEK